jgi:hypothetical protein
MNLANAVLIVGIAYLGSVFGFNLGHFFLIAWGLAMWGYHAGTKEQKRLLDLQIRKLELEVEAMKRKLEERGGSE